MSHTPLVDASDPAPPPQRNKNVGRRRSSAYDDDDDTDDRPNGVLVGQMSTVGLLSAFLVSAVVPILTASDKDELDAADARWHNSTSWRIGSEYSLSWLLSRFVAASGTLNLFVLVSSIRWVSERAEGSTEGKTVHRCTDVLRVVPRMPAAVALFLLPVH